MGHCKIPAEVETLATNPVVSYPPVAGFGGRPFHLRRDPEHLGNIRSPIPLIGEHPLEIQLLTENQLELLDVDVHKPQPAHEHRCPIRLMVFDITFYHGPSSELSGLPKSGWARVDFARLSPGTPSQS